MKVHHKNLESESGEALRQNFEFEFRGIPEYIFDPRSVSPPKVRARKMTPPSNTQTETKSNKASHTTKQS